jgi:hypothetical protein
MECLLKEFEDRIKGLIFFIGENIYATGNCELYHTYRR